MRQSIAGEGQLGHIKMLDDLDILLPIVALENTPGSASIFGAHFRPAECRGLAVGGEARGLSHRILKSAARTIQIPMMSRQINTLNVAAAAAVGLYAVFRGGLPASIARSSPEARRPQLLIIGGEDHFEIGSTIRSAAAFGWKTGIPSR